MADSARANNVIPFTPRSGAGPARPDAFTGPALADRVAALETQLIALEANLTRERNLLTQLSESETAMGAAAWGSSQSARGHDSERNARALLERAMSERRALADQVAKLRAERDALLSEIEALRLGAASAAPEPAIEPEAKKLDDVVSDLRAAMRGLVEDLRAPADAIEAPAPALHEDVEGLPAAQAPSDAEAAQKARQFGLIEDEDVLATAEPAVQETARAEETEPAVPATPIAPDPSIAAMWDALPAAPAAPPADPPSPQAAASVIDVAPIPVVALLPTPSVVERASFITDEFILETSPLLRSRVVEIEPVVEPEPIDEPEPIVERVAPKIEPPPPVVEIAKPVIRTPIVEKPIVHQPVVQESRAPAAAAPAPESVPASNRIQLVISPIESFPRLLAIQHRLEAVSSIHELQLRDFRNGIATFALSVGEAISAHEFGAVVQMLGVGLRLMGATAMNAELRLDEEPATA